LSQVYQQFVNKLVKTNNPWGSHVIIQIYQFDYNETYKLFMFNLSTKLLTIFNLSPFFYWLFLTTKKNHWILFDKTAFGDTSSATNCWKLIRASFNTVGVLMIIPTTRLLFRFDPCNKEESFWNMPQNSWCRTLPMCNELFF